MTTTTTQNGAGIRKAGKILTIIGGIILLLSIIAGVVLAVMGFGKLGSDQGRYQVLAGSGVVSLESGDQVQLYAPEGQAAPMCEVMSPSGATPGGAPSTSSSTTYEGQQWQSFAGFTAEEEGDYAIACDSDQVLVGPPISIGGIFGGVGGILLGVLGGGFGLLLLLIGVILLVLGRNKAKTSV